jgi:hypothetical protein
MISWMPAGHRIWKWFVRSLTAISILFFLATATAWVLSCRNPWGTILAIEKLDSKGYQVWPKDNGSWQIVLTHRAPVISDLAWDVGGDPWQLDIRMLYSFFEWHVYWWRLLLLWLVVPVLQITPWRSFRFKQSTGAIRP